MPAVMLAVIFVIAQGLVAVEIPPPPAPLPSRSIVAVATMPEILDTSYLTLAKREQLWHVFSPEVQERYWIRDLDHLKQLWEKGELVEIPDDPRSTGVVLRKTGRWPIGEKAKAKDRPYFYGLRRAAAGLLYMITGHMRKVEAEKFTPYGNTSLVRSWEYQRKLAKTNPTADVKKQKVPPTHVFGLAFDITRVGLGAKRERRLIAYLDKLAAEGVLIYFLESRPQAAVHVVALPQAERRLVTYYERAIPQVIASGAGP